jgi:hypothetical protein
MRALAAFVGISLLMVGCGVALKNFDIQDQTSEVRIAEDAAIRAVCLQWLADASQTTYEWKCVAVSDLRKELFPKAGVW